MKDGRTHLAHKADHAVDLETGAVVAVTAGTKPDGIAELKPDRRVMAGTKPRRSPGAGTTRSRWVTADEDGALCGVTATEALTRHLQRRMAPEPMRAIGAHDMARPLEEDPNPSLNAETHCSKLRL